MAWSSIRLSTSVISRLLVPVSATTLPRPETTDVMTAVSAAALA